MADLLEYKCPNCGGAIRFDPAAQKMKCPFCGTEFEADALRKFDEALNRRETPASEKPGLDTGAGSDWAEGEQDQMSVYHCQSCGGEIVTDATTAASSCPYCGNPVVMTGRLSGVLKPDRIIPFKLDKKAAVQGFEKHLKGKPLLPRAFKAHHHLEEIKGVYVPFWLFDADIEASVQYDATTVSSWSDLHNDYTETSHYLVTRSGEAGFEDIPADGSSKMPDELMESIEPYDYSAAVDFGTAYLAGYFADKYDVSLEESLPRAEARLSESTVGAFAQTATGYASVEPRGRDIQLIHSRSRYALLPVWLLSTKWQDRTYLFAMNGQTGKFVGDLPVDKGLFWRGFWIRAAVITAILFGIDAAIGYLL